MTPRLTWLEDELFPRQFTLTKPLRRHSRFLHLSVNDDRHVQHGDVIQVLSSGERLLVREVRRRGLYVVGRATGAAKSSDTPSGTHILLIGHLTSIRESHSPAAS